MAPTAPEARHCGTGHAGAPHCETAQEAVHALAQVAGDQGLPEHASVAGAKSQPKPGSSAVRELFVASLRWALAAGADL